MKKIIIFSSILIVGLVSFFIVDNYEAKEDKEKRIRLESYLGSIVYKFWERYDEINSFTSEDININSIKEIKGILVTSDSYSKEIDDIVQQDLLHNINQNLYKTLDNIEASYNQTGSFSKKDTENYKVVFSEVEKTIELIYDIYYVDKNSDEGKVTTKIKNFDELIEVNKRLEKINNSSEESN